MLKWNEQVFSFKELFWEHNGDILGNWRIILRYIRFWWRIMNDLRNIIRYALWHYAFPVILLDADTFGKCQVLSFRYSWIFFLVVIDLMNKGIWIRVVQSSVQKAYLICLKSFFGLCLRRWKCVCKNVDRLDKVIGENPLLNYATNLKGLDLLPLLIIICMVMLLQPGITNLHNNWQTVKVGDEMNKQKCSAEEKEIFPFICS